MSRHKQIQWQLLLALLLVCAIATAQNQQHKVYVHEPNLALVVPKVKSKIPGRSGYDSAYVAYVSKPSVYFSDFFGIQVINRLSKEEILADFVPAYASVKRNDSNQIELNFKEGYSATFLIHTNLRAFGYTIEHDQIFFSDSTWQLFTAHLEKFRGLLKVAKLEKKYLIPNPYYKQELITQKRIQKNPPQVQTVKDSLGVLFNADANAIFLFPDTGHGDSARFATLCTFLTTASYDWVGLEMLSIGWQKDADVFLTQPEGSDAFLAAKKRLVDFYNKGWKIRGTYNSNEDGPWIKLFYILKQRNKKVYALESDDIRYILFRFGETPFGALVRNHLWSERTPANGKGIVFGGSAHFNLKEPANYQDFVFAKNKKRKLYSRIDVNTKKVVLQ